jgi:pyruvate dehydrogenase E1 component
MPEGAADGILRGMYLLRDASTSSAQARKNAPMVQLMGCGAILREVLAAADLLANDWNVASDVWSVTSFNELARDGVQCTRENLFHPEAKPQVPYMTSVLEGHNGPAIASTDYIRLFAESIRPYIADRRYVTLGTDGYGRSDYRSKLRSFFEVDRYYVTLSALHALAQDGTIKTSVVTDAIKKYGIDPAKPNPVTV